MKTTTSRASHEYISGEFIPVETKYGTVHILPQGEQIYCDASGNGKFLTYRGAEIAHSVHMQRRDGVWGLQRDERGSEWCAVYSNRRGSFKTNDTPPSYRKALTEEVVRAVTEYVHLHPECLKEGALREVNNDLYRLEGEITELVEKLNQLYDKRKVLLNQEKEIEACTWCKPPGSGKDSREVGGVCNSCGGSGRDS